MNNQNIEEWDNKLRLGLDELFEDLQSYTGPNIDENFTRTYEYTKSFIKALLIAERTSLLGEVKEDMLKNFGNGNYMDKRANSCECRNCYISGFNDCMKKLVSSLEDVGGGKHE